MYCGKTRIIVQADHAFSEIQYLNGINALRESEIIGI